MKNQKLTGVMTPILTPFNDDLSFAPELYISHAKWLLDQGIHFLSPFGTTGEALSMTVEERLAAVDVLIDGGIDPAVLMPGTGLCNLEDTVKLCSHAIERGCQAVMTLPPFFYKNASDDGLYAYFTRLVDVVKSPDLKICMYHIPPMAGIGFTPALAGRLANDYPDIFIAYKDSSGDFENTKAVIAAAPSVAVFPGSEHFLKEGLEHGGKGCISATCNVNPAAIRHVYDVGVGVEKDDLDKINSGMIGFRKTVENYGPIPAMKGMLAVKRGDSRWRNVRPPIVPAQPSSTETLLEELGSDLNQL
ncbi:MAG: dihydrodipicolinate synthase family protein [Desulfobacterales bacterium]|nr:dihydrodipicolinate synthase family protein [Desulfofustis sp.]MBT8355020.1 dihydrodipicolinate synthase family protein [Desulfofustis sp.]NNF47118.1 dihydrodipicolinate synthase family protein [Desulfofustis sp.]NNK96468.1 dihydrodipicolinate synthase family protein [Desulfobacterales bacterium]RZW17409.1 MAG: dihydrodipicolinate synthase family protein [Desulfobulbaceae bacterium]